MNKLKTFQEFSIMENWFSNIFGPKEIKFPTDPKVIESILKKHQIENYYIHPDGTVDVDGNVDIRDTKYKHLPVKFGLVTKHFMIVNCTITTLVGSPERVRGNFMFTRTNVSSFEGVPKVIEGELHYSDNKNLYSPKGLEELQLGEGFYPDKINSTDSPLTSIFVLFKDFEDFRRSLFYNYIVYQRGTWKIYLKGFQDALDELDIPLPEKVRDYPYTYHKK